MKLEISSFGLAAGIVVAIAFTLCPAFVAVAPEATAEFIGYLLHINIAGLTRPISWVSYFAGVLGLGIWTGLWAAVAAKLYNLLSIK
ncbi:MAG: DUF5676 family membrane protein [Deltaproteobacteria bacterium]|nr:DUF5676 family membrane protein [Deltaproteobacteria bacterium]MDZ4344877.1 DUF5676 family membrane protein [Candidatus Binatia bacterium]